MSNNNRALHPRNLALILLVVLSAIPFLAAGPILPLIDYPNHLARLFIMTELPHDPGLQQFYQENWNLLPNILPDIIVISISRRFDLSSTLVSNTLFMIAIISVIPATVLLHWKLHGTRSWWPLISALFVFNYVLIYGFSNYLVGCTASILVLYLWLVADDWKLGAKALVFSALLFLLCLTHFFAFGLAAVQIGSYEIVRACRTRQRSDLIRLLLSGLPFLATLGIFYALSPTSSSIASVSASSAHIKAGAIFSVLDVGANWLTYLSFATLAAVFFAGLFTGRIAVATSHIPSAAILTLVFLFLPFRVLGGSFVDFRMPYAIALFSVAIIDWDLSGRSACSHWKFRESKRIDQAAAIVVGALILLRIGVVSLDWHRSREFYAALDTALTDLPTYSKLVGFVPLEERHLEIRPPTSHAATYAVLKNRAFVPSVFAAADQQPLRFTDEYEDLRSQERYWSLSGEPGKGHPFRDDRLRRFDAVLIFSGDLTQYDLPQALVPRYIHPKFTLYTVEKEKGP